MSPNGVPKSRSTEMVPWERASGLHSGVHTHTCTYIHICTCSHTHMLISLAYAYLHVHTHTHICPLTCTHMYLFHTHIYISPSLSHTHTPHACKQPFPHIHTKQKYPVEVRIAQPHWAALALASMGRKWLHRRSCVYCAPFSPFSRGHRCSCFTESWVFHLGQIWSIYRLFAKPGQLLSRHVPLPTKSSLPANARFPRLQSSMPVLPTVTAPSHRCWRSLGNLARATEEVNFKSGLF